MKKKQAMKILNEQEIAKLKEKFGSLTFSADFDIVYEQQVPNTGFIILQGQVVKTKRRKEVETLPPGSMVGVEHLRKNMPFKCGYKVIAPAELIILSKLDILQGVKEDNTLKTILGEES